MDALSDLLRVLRFESGIFLDARFRGPWCAHSQVTADDYPAGPVRPAALIGFHFVLAGEIQVAVPGQTAQTAIPGDLILLPRNEPHLIGSDLSAPPLDDFSLIVEPETGIPRVDHGDDGLNPDHVVCGYLATTSVAHPLLACLPSLLVTSRRHGPDAAWVENSFRYVAQEHAAARPGAQSIVAQLAELLFVVAIREHIGSLPTDAQGWLAALRDPPLSRALAAIHAQVAHPWTTEALAQQAFLSRSAFAERFTRTVGQPPMSYLTRWRMLLAAQRLRESPATIAQVAAEVGYESEATFSRAFSREMGAAPGIWRRQP